jgi:hypothetical protein
MAVTWDIVREADVRISRDGVLITRCARVDGITSQTAAGRLISAVNQLNVVIGSPFPDPAVMAVYPVYLEEIHPQPWAQNSRTQAKVTLVYRSPNNSGSGNGTSVEFDGSLQTVTTNYDADGNPVVVRYTPTAGGATAAKPVIGQLTGTKSTGILTVTRQVSTNPKSLLVYLNKLNSEPYLGQAAYTWMVGRIAYKKTRGLLGWTVNFVLNYDEETHIKTAVWRDVNGFIPEDVDANAAANKALGEANGYTNALVNRSADLRDMLPESVVDF